MARHLSRGMTPTPPRERLILGRCTQAKLLEDDNGEVANGDHREAVTFGLGCLFFMPRIGEFFSPDGNLTCYVSASMPAAVMAIRPDRSGRRRKDESG
jgi:hypothetical protein